jgi:hypothetical protein
LKRRTREDLPSVYNLAQTFNLVVAARVVAMSNAGQVCRDPSDPFDDRGPCTPFNQSAFDKVLTEAAEVNHALVGAIRLYLDHPFCLFRSCTYEVSTVRLSSMWQKFSDYWFRIPNQPFVFCACNVWAHRCAPLGDVEGYCTSDWTFLLPQEAAKIESVFNADPVVTTVRIALQGLVDGGFGHVGQGLFAGMIEQVF